MKRAEELGKEIENIDKELCRLEQLGKESDRYYYVLQMHKLAVVAELEFCVEHDL